MRLGDRQKAGLILFAGAVQFAIGLTVAEAWYPGYSVSMNFISDLGVGPAANIFNTSIMLLGITILLTAWFLFRGFKDPILSVVIAFAGVGAIGVGIFTEDFPTVHTIVSFITFFFAALAAILAFRIVPMPLNVLSVILGAISFLALGLFATGNFAGLGRGGMERMIVWPVLTWAIGFGGYLIGRPASESTPSG